MNYKELGIADTATEGRMERWGWDGRQGRDHEGPCGSQLVTSWCWRWAIGGCKPRSFLIRLDFGNITLVEEKMMASELQDWGRLGGCCDSAGKGKWEFDSDGAPGWRGPVCSMERRPALMNKYGSAGRGQRRKGSQKGFLRFSFRKWKPLFLWESSNKYRVERLE